ncbi:MAG: shikimate dehydrogenase [Flavobacteriales bacterium]
MRRYALIGNPLGHSFSAQYFNDKFKREGIDAEYVLLPLGSIENIREIIRNENLSGLNVTIPYKAEIIPYLDSQSPKAEAIGAVNCIKVKDDQLIGYNTDAFGFEESLRSFTEDAVKNALVLGNGGSSKAVQYVLNKLQIRFKVVSRTGSLNYENLHPAEVSACDLIVNTTPLGMYPSLDALPMIPYEAVCSRHFVFDLIYNPEETVFLKRCRLLGAKTRNGLEMLYLQAEKSWELWN